MSSFVIPIDGKSTKIEVKPVLITNLQLDELNPRISFFKDNQVTDRLTESQVIFALTNKKPEAFRKLKDSIHNNRGIMYAIWVEPLRKPSHGKKYRVIEGNSRVVAYMNLQIDEPYEIGWKSIICNILPNQISEDQKNFIRLQSHLRGTTEWDAYEKAKYLYKLWQEDGWSIGRLEKQTKMSEKQIKENIDAYRIMEEQYLPNYSDDPNEVGKFSYFVEYAKDEKLKKLMGKNSKGVEDFCDWVSDKNKLPTGQDVRRLRDILESPETFRAFNTGGFESAMQILAFKKPNLVSSFYKDVESCIDGLKDISAQELDSIVEEDNGQKEKLIRSLAHWSQKLVDMIEREKNGNQRP